ncbi:MAG TPA: hypothetical protein PKW82_05770 [Spirochaetales bacterium]|nr:hypothetical protein [Spirochaetales bacterium]
MARSMIKIAIAAKSQSGVPARDLVVAARKAGVEGVSWCSRFAPPGDKAAAEALMLDTLRGGLTTVAYEVDGAPLDGDGFRAVIASAEALHAPIVVAELPVELERRRGLAARATRALFIEKVRRAGDLLEAGGLTLVFDPTRWRREGDMGEALGLAREIAHPSVRLRWEPPASGGFDELMESMQPFAGWIRQLVARPLGPDGGYRPLGERAEEWQHWLDFFERNAGLAGMAHWVVLHDAGAGGPGFGPDAAWLRQTAAKLARLRGCRERG